MDCVQCSLVETLKSRMSRMTLCQPIRTVIILFFFHPPLRRDLERDDWWQECTPASVLLLSLMPLSRAPRYTSYGLLGHSAKLEPYCDRHALKWVRCPTPWMTSIILNTWNTYSLVEYYSRVRNFVNYPGRLRPWLHGR